MSIYSRNYTHNYFIENEEKYNELISSISEDCAMEDIEEPLDEGANIDMTKKFREYKKEYKGYLKNIKKLYKENKISECEKEINKAKRLVTKMKGDIKEIDASNAGSTVFGFIAGTLINLAKYFGTALISNPIAATYTTIQKYAAGKAVGMATFSRTLHLMKNMSLILSVPFTAYYDLIDLLYGKNRKDNYNLYKTKLLQACDQLNAALNSWMSKIKRKSKKGK